MGSEMCIRDRDKESENGTVSVRTRSGGDRGAMALDKFVADICEEIRTRSLDLAE